VAAGIRRNESRDGNPSAVIVGCHVENVNDIPKKLTPGWRSHPGVDL
jgi:hypothetical protein